MHIDIFAAVILFVVAVYVATVVKLQASKHNADSFARRLAINVAYITFVFIVMMIIFSKFNIQPSTSGLFLTLAIVFVIALFQSSIDDIVAFTLVSITNIYQIGNLIRVGPNAGQIAEMSMLAATIVNHFTKIKTIIPHGKIYTTFESI